MDRVDSSRRPADSPVNFRPGATGISARSTKFRGWFRRRSNCAGTSSIRSSCPRCWIKFSPGVRPLQIADIKIGQNAPIRASPALKWARIPAEALNELMLRLRQHGAEVVEQGDARLASGPVTASFPDDFYVTTNQQTFVRIDGHEIEVQPATMDSAIAVDAAKSVARAVKFYEASAATRSSLVIRASECRRCSGRPRTPTCFEFINAPSALTNRNQAVIREIADELTERARRTEAKLPWWLEKRWC